MAKFEFNGKSFYIDGRLKEQLEKKIIPYLKRKDKDVVFIVDGMERSGKSVFAMQIGAFASSLLGSKFDLSCVCMAPDEWKKKIENADKNQVVIYDEAHRGMASRRALSEINKILIDLMMEMGQKNLFVIVVLPTFFMLDKYPALFRARGLFHIYEKGNQRGFWTYFNQKYKLKLYMKGKREFNYNCMRWPGFRGRFYDQYTLIEEEYRKKKADAFKTRVTSPRVERWLGQRDILLWILHKELNIGSPKLSRLLKSYNFDISRQGINVVLAKFRAKQKKVD